MPVSEDVTLLKAFIVQRDVQGACTFLDLSPNRIEMVELFLRNRLPHMDESIHDGDDLLLAALLEFRRGERLDAIRYSGVSYDFLERRAGRINLVKALCLAVFASEPHDETCAVVVTVRNEGPFFVEWLAHQKAIGFSDVYVYTNDNNDGTDELLVALAREGHIWLTFNDTGLDLNPQIKAYEHAIFCDPRIRQHKWVMFLDADEFLVLNSQFDFNITNFLAGVKPEAGNYPSCICFNWLWFGSNGLVEREPRPITERFQTAAWVSPFVKSVMRLEDITSMQGVHKPYLVNGATIVSGDFTPVDPQHHYAPFATRNGRINHYWQKSFQEFLMKQDRGRERNIWERHTELFFNWDILVTPENKVLFEDTLCARRQTIEAKLTASERVRRCAAFVEQQYQALSERLCSQAQLQTYYMQQKFRAGLLKIVDVEPLQ